MSEQAVQLQRVVAGRGGAVGEQAVAHVAFVDADGAPVDMIGLPAAPEEGVFVLTATDGVIAWVAAE